MARFFKKREEMLGEAPGSLIFIGTQKITKPEISIMCYNEENILEKENITIEEINNHVKDDVCWINITGIHDSSFIRQIGNFFNIHNLVLEDIMNTAQRAKFEEFDDYCFTAMKMLKYLPDIDKVTTEQLSIIHKGNLIITFQEEFGDVFSDVRYRINNSKGIVRKEDSSIFCIFY